MWVDPLIIITLASSWACVLKLVEVVRRADGVVALMDIATKLATKTKETGLAPEMHLAPNVPLTRMLGDTELHKHLSSIRDVPSQIITHLMHLLHHQKDTSKLQVPSASGEKPRR